MEQTNQNVVQKAGSLTPEQLGELDALVVVSKIKTFIRNQADMNTSADAIEAITRKVAEETIKAIGRAKEAGRKTVMARDFE